MGFPSFNE